VRQTDIAILQTTPDDIEAIGTIYVAPDTVGFKHGRWLDTLLLRRSLPR
jgi:hypothetical protein